jgi:hypothetical protein
MGWTRNTIRMLLLELEEYGLIEALQGPEFRPFDNKRAQVYRVEFPRLFVEARWKAAKKTLIARPVKKAWHSCAPFSIAILRQHKRSPNSILH